jgi:hypothetical protein
VLVNPEECATAAKTFRPRGEGVHFPDLVPGLGRSRWRRLASITWCAQGLCEVLAGLGMYDLDVLFPDIIVIGHRCGVSSEKVSNLEGVLRVGRYEEASASP